ncbi:GHF5 endo-1,4-beta-glucanase precursor [Aphelenchoides avenae]|nr:GHF5 endo-1,4-beta-glucanase precursor [Aphelenchus avenae]
MDPDNVALLGTPAWSGASEIQADSYFPHSGSGAVSAKTPATGKTSRFVIFDISYVNWTINDMPKSSPAVDPATQPSHVGNANKWSNSGKYIQKILKSKNNGGQVLVFGSEPSVPFPAPVPTPPCGFPFPC